EQVRDAFWARTGFPVDPGAAVERLKERLSDAFDRFLAGVADKTGRSRSTTPGGGSRRTRPSRPTRRSLTASPSCIAGWTPAVPRSGWPTCSSRSRTISDSTSTSSSPARSKSTPARSAPCSPRSSPTAAISASTPWRRSRPTSPTRRLKYVSDWRLVEENQRAALATIVHGISRLDAAGHWGDGTTSASDGQRFAVPHKVLQRTYSTRFNDFALEFYSFVADNYAPFYSRPVECTDRDAPFVLDGVLYHESDLDLEEHYTDTHGYTEINFAAFGMIGMRFSCSCLTLILACIVYWQAREISRLAAAPDFPFDRDLLRHVSPIEWKKRHPLRRDQDRPRQAHEARSLACISTRIWSVPYVRPVEAGDEHARVVQVQPLPDLPPRRFVRRGGEGDARHGGKALVQHRELQVLRAEVVTPLRHAMRLVDRDVDLVEQRERPLPEQPLESRVEQVDPARAQSGLHVEHLLVTRAWS
ncbi:MAG: Tn3 family transposase, partial [Chloroflexi bacterium]|nr:Tn3 family transposase [Chloroflexota bacterium]